MRTTAISIRQRSRAVSPRQKIRGGVSSPSLLGEFSCFTNRVSGNFVDAGVMSWQVSWYLDCPIEFSWGWGTSRLTYVLRHTVPACGRYVDPHRPREGLASLTNKCPTRGRSYCRRGFHYESVHQRIWNVLAVLLLSFACFYLRSGFLEFRTHTHALFWGRLS